MDETDEGAFKNRPLKAIREELLKARRKSQDAGRRQEKSRTRAFLLTRKRDPKGRTAGNHLLHARRVALMREYVKKICKACL